MGQAPTREGTPEETYPTPSDKREAGTTGLLRSVQKHMGHLVEGEQSMSPSRK